VPETQTAAVAIPDLRLDHAPTPHGPLVILGLSQVLR
jgi:hypothetical protein